MEQRRVSGSPPRACGEVLALTKNRVVGAWIVVAFSAVAIPSPLGAHQCGPTRLEIPLGAPVPWQITADLTEALSVYTPLTLPDAAVATVTPSAEFEEHHGVFTITPVRVGTTTLKVRWFYPPTGMARECALEIVVTPAKIPSCYEVKIIDSLGGATGKASGVSPNCTSVGSAERPDSAVHAFSSNAGPVVDLGSLGKYSSASDINSSGTICGETELVADTGILNACVWQNGVIVPLPLLAGGSHSRAQAINDTGTVAGTMGIAGGEHPVVWIGGQPADLGTFGGSAGESLGINAGGQVVGYAMNAQNARMPFVWPDLATGGKKQLPPLKEGGGAEARGINDSGVIVGGSIVTGGFHATIWQDGQPKDLGTLGGTISVAQDINNAGLIVGYSDTGDDTKPVHAFISNGQTMVDLNSFAPEGFAFVLSRATTIGSDGKIVGFAGYTLNPDVVRGFVMIPKAGGGQTGGGAEVSCPPAPAPVVHPYVRGDANGDAQRDITDAVFTLGFLFLEPPASPFCQKASDFNDDGAIDISDPVGLLGYLFLGQAALIHAPSARCGPDATDDELGCDAASVCP